MNGWGDSGQISGNTKFSAKFGWFVPPFFLHRWQLCCPNSWKSDGGCQDSKDCSWEAEDAALCAECVRSSVNSAIQSKSSHGDFQKWWYQDTSIAGWFIVENPIQMDDGTRGTPMTKRKCPYVIGYGDRSCYMSCYMSKSIARLRTCSPHPHITLGFWQIETCWNIRSWM